MAPVDVIFPADVLEITGGRLIVTDILEEVVQLLSASQPVTLTLYVPSAGGNDQFRGQVFPEDVILAPIAMFGVPVPYL